VVHQFVKPRTLGTKALQLSLCGQLERDCSPLVGIAQIFGEPFIVM
jgi:hypothetical protein